MDYEKLLNRSVREIKPSGIRKFFDIAAEMDDVISLSVGEPDFQTPWHVRQAGIVSLEKGRTKYTSNRGDVRLRREISDYLARRFDTRYDPDDEIVVTVGGSEAIDIAMRTLIAPGDEVLVVEPCFVCYEPIARLCGAKVVTVPTCAEDCFKLTPELLKKYLTPATKLLVLPFPNNPTGAILTKEELEGIAAVLRGTNTFVLSDEIYGELTYGRSHTSIASLEGMRERTVVVNGFSKSYAMTGWRLGYAAAPREIALQMTKVHQFAIMCAPTTAQFAAIEALRNGDDDIAEMREQYDMRRRLLVGSLRNMGIPCFEPEGAFYVFPQIGAFGLSSQEFCEKLLFTSKVAIVPGDAFGASGEGFARISYSYSVNHIAAAMARMQEFVKTL
ncbi:MAG: aminotransferase class I/II-fold pyridoxal phosphate-dependent enzyme [Clostridia bacterium]|nr:aminotransferase class I/II-fold pyridoxal phosphate-dependent enzyme [Clostridia bacterium]